MTQRERWRRRVEAISAIEIEEQVLEFMGKLEVLPAEPESLIIDGKKCSHCCLFSVEDLTR
jgi:hypothetical protein